ncbi:MAG: ComEC family competence protein [bacterium]|nr:ComEC family competence protein [bacterium]
MRFVAQRAYLQLFIALALGIAAGFRWHLPSQLLAYDGAWLLVALAALGVIAWTWRGHRAPVALGVLFMLTALAGMVTVSLSLHSALDSTLRSVAAQTDYVRGTVASIPKYQRGHWRFLLEVDRARVNDGWQAAPGRVYAFWKAPVEQKLYFRERITLWTEVKEIAPAPNRGQFNYRRYLLQRGTVLTAYAPTVRSLRHLGDNTPQPWATLTDLRTKLLAAVTRALPPELGQLAASVTYGDKITELPEQLEERFRRAGLTHILVASGTQVSLLIAVLGLLLWRVGDNSTWRGRLLNFGKFALTLLFVMAYGAVTGFETSIVRALVMGVVVLVGQAVSREADGLTALSQAGLVLLLLNPLELLAPGFQLSFGATFGLIYSAGVCFPMTTQLSGWRRALVQMLITTAGAQLFVAPILAAQFNQLSLWGLLSNFLAIPLAFALLIVGGVASLGLAWVPLLGLLLQYVVYGLSWLLNAIASLFAALPGSSIAVPTPSLWWLLVCYALIFVVGEWIKAQRTKGTADPPDCQSVAALFLPQWAAGSSPHSIVSAPTQFARIAAPLLALLLITPALYWLQVPQPELAVLALPNAEAYIWRSAGGRNALLLRRAGLLRSHNTDTIVSALRCRGINKLHAIVWLDGTGDPSPLPDYPAPVFAYGEPLPQLDVTYAIVPHAERVVLRVETLHHSVQLTPAADARTMQVVETGSSEPLLPRVRNEEYDILLNGARIVVREYVSRGP